jgi:hypothetical protein
MHVQPYDLYRPVHCEVIGVINSSPLSQDLLRGALASRDSVKWQSFSFLSFPERSTTALVHRWATESGFDKRTNSRDNSWAQISTPQPRCLSIHDPRYPPKTSTNRASASGGSTTGRRSTMEFPGSSEAELFCFLSAHDRDSDRSSERSRAFSARCRSPSDRLSLSLSGD